MRCAVWADTTLALPTRRCDQIDLMQGQSITVKYLQNNVTVLRSSTLSTLLSELVSEGACVRGRCTAACVQLDSNCGP